MKEEELPNAGFTLYYDQHFFDTLRHYHETSPLNITTMSIKQWYSILMEDNLLMVPATENSPPVPLPVRVENMFPSNDW